MKLVGALGSDCKDAPLGRVGYYGFDGNENLPVEVRTKEDREKEERIKRRIAKNWDRIEWTDGLDKDEWLQKAGLG